MLELHEHRLRCGKLEELGREIENYTWDAIGLVETRRKGTGEEITDNDHTYILV